MLGCYVTATVQEVIERSLCGYCDSEVGLLALPSDIFGDDEQACLRVMDDDTIARFVPLGQYSVGDQCPYIWQRCS